MKKEAVAFSDVTFTYGRRYILEHVSFNVEQGERVCLFGESGSGKTTITRLISGLEKPESGTVTINGKTSVCFQEDRLMPFKNVRDNVSFFCKNDNAEQESATVLHKLGLYEDMNKYPSELSGGMSRRVSIARTLIYGGDIYIFDEPFNGLDEENVSATADVIKKYTEGKTLILISHRQEDIELLECRKICMNEINKA